MIDAYTIGITLALNDGVSDGIKAIRRDLAVLDASMDASATRLTLLRRLASEIVFPADHESSAGQVTASPRQSGTSVEKTAPPDADAAPMAPLSQSGDLPAQTPAIPAMAPIAAPNLPVLPSPIAEPSTTTVRRDPVVPVSAPSALAPRTFSPPPAPVPATVLAGPAPMPMVDVRPAQAAPVESLPTRAAAPPIHNRSVAFAQIGSFAPNPGSESPDPRTAAPASPAPPPARPAAIASPSERPFRPLAIAPAAPVSAFAPSVPPVVMKQAAQHTARPSSAPVSVSPAPLPAPSPPPSGTPPATVPAAASASSEAAPTVHGEIYLDSSPLGRWVTRHLEKQVLRPPVGATGFDPRMTPSWPGAPTGN